MNRLGPILILAGALCAAGFSPAGSLADGLAGGTAGGSAGSLTDGSADGLAGVSAGGLAANTPWDACDRLETEGVISARPGWRLALGVTGWEAAAGDFMTQMHLAREPAHGFGLAATWRRYWLAETVDADDGEAEAVLRTPGWRVAVGVGVLRRGERRQERCVLAGHARVLDRLVAGARVRVYPSEDNGAPEVIAGLYGAREPWWGGLEMGPRTGELRYAVALRTGSGLIWTSRWSGGHPEMGLVWGGGGGELRATHAPHPLLGSVNHLRVVAGGLRP